MRYYKKQQAQRKTEWLPKAETEMHLYKLTRRKAHTQKKEQGTHHTVHTCTPQHMCPSRNKPFNTLEEVAAVLNYVCGQKEKRHARLKTAQNESQIIQHQPDQEYVHSGGLVGDVSPHRCETLMDDRSHTVKLRILLIQ